MKAYKGLGRTLLSTCSRGAFRVVICRACVVNNFFKHLLSNHLANLDQTWQKCSFGGPLKIIHSLILSKPLVAMATEWNFLSNF